MFDLKTTLNDLRCLLCAFVLQYFYEEGGCGDGWMVVIMQLP